MLLSKRLQKIAGYVAQGSRAADVGTDHGYIPVWLIQNGVCEHIIASDIRPEPLKRAMENAEKNEVSDKIRFLLCPGLEQYPQQEIDTVIIAGMGGETIIEILADAPWTREKKVILQPQTKIPELRSWLNANGYEVDDASLVADMGRIYVVWSCTAGGGRELPAHELYVDRTLLEKRDELLGLYIDTVVKKLRHKAQGMKRAARADQMELERCQAAICGLLKMKEEAQNAQGKGDK